MLDHSRQVNPGQLFDTSKESIKTDLKILNIRNLLLNVVANKETPKKVKETAVKLLLRQGLIYGSGEDLILAAILQEEHSIDLREDMEYLCRQSEEIMTSSASKIESWETKDE